MRPASERVTAGVAFMNEHDPGWWRPDVDRAIDLDVLDLQLTYRCVLGQRCPREYRDLDDGYSPYRAYAIRLSGSTDGVSEWAAGLGLDHYPGESYGNLNAEWKRIILARRKALPAVTS